MTRHGPSPETPYPIPGAQRLGFLKNFITRPGMVKFLKANLDQGIIRVQELVAAKGGLANVNLHDIDGEIFAALKALKPKEE